MKKWLIILIILLLIIIMILYPSTILYGAKNGLLLWYSAVLPALFPFMIISGLFINSGLSSYLPPKVFCIIAGLFFGCPACSLVCVSFYKKGQISKNSANFLSSAFNNISPSFISGFFCAGLLKSTKCIKIVLILFYISLLSSTLIIRFTIFRKCFPDKFSVSSEKMKGKRVLDLSLMAAINNIVKVGGYIIIFSIIAAFIRFVVPKVPAAYLCSITEITNGLKLLNELNMSQRLTILVSLPFLALGGVSGMFQVFSLDEDQVLDKKKYICSKVIAFFVCAVTVFTAYVLKII